MQFIFKLTYKDLLTGSFKDYVQPLRAYILSLQFDSLMKIISSI